MNIEKILFVASVTLDCHIFSTAFSFATAIFFLKEERKRLIMKVVS